MVKGLDLFQKNFATFKGQYILIGGAACDLLFEDNGVQFRATRDLDIVLCLESLDQRFADAFWRFVEAGGYEMRERSSGRPEFFRFSGEGLDNAEASMYLGRRMVICIRYSRIIDNCSQS